MQAIESWFRGYLIRKFIQKWQTPYIELQKTAVLRRHEELVFLKISPQ